MNFLQNEIVLGVLVFTLAVNLMVFIILGARKLLVSSGNVSISMNEAAKSVEVEAGGKLLQTLASQNLFLSSACGGGGTCAQCKCRVVSGGGSNFKAIHSFILSGSIDGEVVAVVTNAPTCGGAEYARQHGIDVLIYPPTSRGDGSPGAIDDVNLTAIGTTSPGSTTTREDGISVRVSPTSAAPMQTAEPLSTSGLTEALHQVSCSSTLHWPKTSNILLYLRV